MKWYFATSYSNLDYLLECKVKSILISFAYCKKGLSDKLLRFASKEGNNLMLDSGGFTIGVGGEAVKFDEYLEFLDEYGEKVTEYAVLDHPRKREITIRNYKRMLEKGYNPLFIDHLWFRNNDFVSGEYKKGSKLCWGGIDSFNLRVESKVTERILGCYKRAKAGKLSNVHLLAVGQKLRKFVPFFDIVDSFDSTTWLSPGKFGSWTIYYPPNEGSDFPQLKQHKPPWYEGKRPPEKAYQEFEKAKLSGYKYRDRIIMAIRQLKKYYRGLEKYFERNKDNKEDLFRVASVAKSDSDMEYVPKTYLLKFEPSKKLVVGKFFAQPKPTRAARLGELQSVERLKKMFEVNSFWLPTMVQKKFDGARHQVHKNGSDVVIYSEDGRNNTSRFPRLIEEIKKLKSKKLILDCEIEAWSGRQHLPREVVAAYLHSKDKPDDSNFVANVFDILYADKDVHEHSTAERISILSKIAGKNLEVNSPAEAKLGPPDLSKRINFVRSFVVETPEELAKVTEIVRRAEGSEGIVAKQVDAPYRLALTTKDEWAKYHNATTINAMVYEKIELKNRGYTYNYGVLDPKKTTLVNMKVGDVEITPMGSSFNSILEIEVGEGILIEAETVNYTETPNGIELTAWVPRAIQKIDGKKIDDIQAVKRRARKDLVLQEKVVTDDGKIIYKELSKQQDPYLEIPDENEKYEFVVHQHWRGKSVHSDLRLELKQQKLLIGWTLNTQIEGVIKEPVVTLEQAKRVAKENMDEYSKINWNTGEWKLREKEGAGKPVRTSILAERKAVEPYPWISAEGVTAKPTSGLAPVGGTANYPGVFLIVDKGAIEYGTQKPWFHEYFFHGKALKQRLIFRQLKLSKSIYSINKEDVLPPSDEQNGIDEAQWLCMYPDDQTPYVLSADAVEKKWMPPSGVSALPEFIRKQIPDKMKFWKQKNQREVRDELVGQIKEGNVQIEFEKTEKSLKRSKIDSVFALQKQTWKDSSASVRLGPSKTKWTIRLDIGKSELIEIELENSPLDNDQVAAYVGTQSHVDSLMFSGDVPPGHYLNSTKGTPSKIELVDSGKSSILSDSADFVKIQFDGKKLKGIYQLERNDSEWLWSKPQESPGVKDMEEVHIEFGMPIAKVNNEKQIVTGIVLEPDTVDGQGDTIDSDAIERAAHNFLSRYNRETKMGLLHRMFGEIGVDLVESYLCPVDLEMGEQQVSKGTWIMSVKVRDDNLWKKIKSGEITGFSIGGTAAVV